MTRKSSNLVHLGSGSQSFCGLRYSEIRFRTSIVRKITCDKCRKAWEAYKQIQKG